MELLRKIVDKLESRETKKALARYKITPVNKIFSLKKLHCYAFEPVKKRCSFSVLLTGMTLKLDFREKSYSEIIGVLNEEDI